MLSFVLSFFVLAKALVWGDLWLPVLVQIAAPMLTLGSYFAQNVALASTLRPKPPKAQPKHYRALIALVNRRRIRRNRRMAASQRIRRNHKHRRIRHHRPHMAGNQATRPSNHSNHTAHNRRRIRRSNRISNLVTAIRRRLLGANPKARCR